jgi:uncharacterized membrane protein YheB (UPF0754 family)
MISALLSNFIGGGFTGFITNTLAIKMLFRKYPIVGGGVLLKNFDQFVENISELVERDLINHHTLKDEFNKDQFKQALKRAVEHLLNVSLYRTFDDIPLENIHGFSQTVDAILDRLDDVEREHIDNIFSIVLQNIDPKEILTPQQLDHLLSYLFISIEAFAKEEFETIYEAFVANVEDKSFDEFISHRLIKGFIDSYLHPSTPLYTQLKNLHEDIAAFGDQLLETVDIGAIVREGELRIKEHSITTLLGDHNLDKLIETILDFFYAYMQTKEGKATTDRLGEVVLEILLHIDHPLTHFLRKDSEAKLIDVINIYLPIIIEYLLTWLDTNAKELEELIDRVIDNALKSGGLLGKVKLALKEIFVGKITEKFNVIGRVKEYLQDASSQQEMVDTIVHHVIKAVSKRNIGDLTAMLVEKEFLSAPLIAKFIGHNMVLLGTLSRAVFIERAFNVPLETLFSKDHSEALVTWLRVNIDEKVLEGFVYTPSMDKKVKTFMVDKSETLMKQTIATVLPPTKRLIPIVDHYLDDLQRFKTPMIEMFNANVPNDVDAMFSSFSMYRTVYDIAFEAYSAKKSEEIESFKAFSLHTLFDKVKAYDQSAQKLTVIASTIIDENLDFILQGNVATAVEKELKTLGAPVLQERVEEFMGEELWPITWLGAGLGAGIGLSTVALSKITPIFVPPFAYGAIPLVYGATGIFTNWLALKMLFQPYHAKYIGNVKVPFTPGIVGKRQPKFAKNMSIFVDETLLTQQAIEAKVNAYREEIVTKLKEHIAKDNFEFFENYVQKHLSTLSYEASDVATTFGVKMIKNHRDTIVKESIAKLLNVQYRDFYDRLSMEELWRFVDEAKAPLTKQVQSFVSEQKQNKKHLSELLPEAVKQTVLDLLDDMIDNALKEGLHYCAKSDHVKTLNQRAFDLIYPEIKFKKAENFLTQDMRTIVNDHVQNYIQERFHSQKSEDRIIDFIQNKLLHEHLHQDTKIEEIFNGTLVEQIQKNVTLFFSHGHEKIVELLKNERTNIKNESIAMLKQRNNFVTNQMLGVAGVFGDMARVIDLLIDEELPTFFYAKKEQLEEKVTHLVNDFSHRSLHEFSWLESAIDTEQIRPILHDVLQNRPLLDLVVQISQRIMNDMLKLSIFRLFRLVDVDNGEDFANRFSLPLSIMWDESCARVSEESDAIAEQLKMFKNKMVHELIFEQSVSKYFRQVPHDVIEKSTQQFMDAFFALESVKQVIEMFVDTFLKRLEVQGIEKFIDLEVLDHDLSQLIDRLTKDRYLHNQIKSEIMTIFSHVLQHLNSSVADEFKEFFLDHLLDAGYDTLIDNVEDVVSSIDLKGVIEREINAMHPKELEDMLNSFAKIYFNRLIMYGGYGALFGIPVAFAL